MEMLAREVLPHASIEMFTSSEFSYHRVHAFENKRKVMYAQTKMEKKNLRMKISKKNWDTSALWTVPNPTHRLSKLSPVSSVHLVLTYTLEPLFIGTFLF